MRILIVSQYFWPESNRINDVAQGFSERGHQVTVLTGIPNYPEGRFHKGYGFFKNWCQDYNGVKIIRVPLIPRYRGKSYQLVLNYFSFAFWGMILAPFLCHEKYDFVFVYQVSPITMALPAILLKKIKKVPLVLYVLDLWPESIAAVGAIKSKRILSWVGKMVRFIYKNCDKILVSSKGFIPRVTSYGIEISKVFYWPQWAEELYQIVKADESFVEYQEMPKGFRVMFAGNIGAAQGFETIINAAERLKKVPDIQWVILGDGRMKPWVDEQVKKRGLNQNFHLLGKKPVETMPRYFALADALLVTLKKEEIFALTLPAKVQSYLACGRSILAAVDGEGAAVVEEAGAGLTCPADDAESLARIVLEMYELSEAARNIMGANGRKYFESHFKRDALLDQFESCIHELLLSNDASNSVTTGPTTNISR